MKRKNTRSYESSYMRVMHSINYFKYIYSDTPSVLWCSKFTGISHDTTCRIFRDLSEVGFLIYKSGSFNYFFNENYLPNHKKKEVISFINEALKICRKDIYTEAENDHGITQTRYLACRA